MDAFTFAEYSYSTEFYLRVTVDQDTLFKDTLVPLTVMAESDSFSSHCLPSFRQETIGGIMYNYHCSMQLPSGTSSFRLFFTLGTIYHFGSMGKRSRPPRR